MRELWNAQNSRSQPRGLIQILRSRLTKGGGGSLGLSADEEHMASLQVPPEPQWFWCRVNQVSWWQMHSSSAAEREMDSLVGIPFIVSSVTFPSSSQLRIWFVFILKLSERKDTKWSVTFHILISMIYAKTCKCTPLYFLFFFIRVLNIFHNQKLRLFRTKSFQNKSEEINSWNPATLDHEMMKYIIV